MKRLMQSFVGLTLLAVLTVLAAPGAVLAQGKVEVLWLGQAAVRITSPGGKVIMIDPFLKKNPKTPAKWKDLKALGKVDVILVTHGHFDHIADAGALAKLTGAKIAGGAELVRNMAAYGMVPAKQVIAMNKGGTITPIGPGIKLTLVPADHSSSLGVPHPSGKGQHYVFGGPATGWVIQLENGFTIYHSGDTNVFTDMSLIAKLYPLDLAMISIGGHFTMDPRGAAHAVGQLLRPKMALPIHYGTFPPLKGTPAQFKAALGNAKVRVLDLQPGGSLKF
ncbi:MAG TPA: metal-dependent hydrolase [Alphaproteobacteria bacterium]|nr:metal-dependent hydrolase [Alphaproteobacteria bacterium]